MSQYVRPMKDGMEFQKKGVYHEAEKKFREVLSICDNKHTGASYSLACVLMYLAADSKDYETRQRYMTEALDHCNQAIEGAMSREPQNRWKMLLECVQFMLQYTGVMKLDGDLSVLPICNTLKHKILREVIDILRTCAEVAPTNQKVWSYLTQVLTIEKRYHEAVSAYESYLGIGQNDSDVLINYRYAKSLQRAGKFPEALAAYAKTVELSQGSHATAMFWTRVLLEKVRIYLPRLRGSVPAAEDPTNVAEIPSNPSPLASTPPAPKFAVSAASSAYDSIAIPENIQDILAQASDVLARFDTSQSGPTDCGASSPNSANDSRRGDAHGSGPASSADVPSGTRSRPLIPHEYIRKLFDRYAPTFERHLTEELQYSTPERMAQVLQQWVNTRTTQSTADQPQRWLWHLAGDIGCGTGLGAVAFRALAQAFYGCDLSPRMVEEAKKRESLYTEVVAEEAVAWLQGKPDGFFDLLLAADVLNYMGDLAPMFEQVSRVLSRRDLEDAVAEPADDAEMHSSPAAAAYGPSVFVFSVEQLTVPSEDHDHSAGNDGSSENTWGIAHSAATDTSDGPTSSVSAASSTSSASAAGAGFKLSSDGRCQHSSQYIHEVARTHGMVVFKEEVVILRKNAGVDVHGVIFIVGKAQ